MVQKNLQRNYYFFILLASLIFAISSGCTNRNKQDLQGSNNCDTIDTKFSSVINNIIVTKCNTQSGCHGGPSFGSISLEGYQNVKDNYIEIVSRIKSGNMPKNNAALDDCSIVKIETWVNRGAQNN